LAHSVAKGSLCPDNEFRRRQAQMDLMKTLDAYSVERTRASGGYDIAFLIRNLTDTRFDDSSFAWTFPDGGGATAAGYDWPANQTKLVTGIHSGGVVNQLGGQLFVGKLRIPLPYSPVAAPGTGFNGGSWTVRKQNGQLVASWGLDDFIVVFQNG
jgi:hypothetical protein